MAINWAALSGEANEFTALAKVTDPISGAIDVTWCGLYTRLSDVVAGLPATGFNSLSIYADTLVLDVPSIRVSALVVMARVVDVSGLAGAPLLVEPLGDTAFAEFLVGSTAGGTLTAAAAAGGSAVTPQVGATTLDAALYSVTAAGGLTAVDNSGNAAVVDLVSRSWALNTLNASFAAGASLFDGSGSDRQVAQAMFAWIVACTASRGAGTGVLPSDYAELYNQAAALSIMLSVQSGAVFVPVLSQQLYSQQMDRLLATLGDYEQQQATLATRTDIAAAIATVSAALQGVATDEAAPLQVQLDNISQNTDSLYADIQQLQGEFTRQTQEAHTRWQVLGTVIRLETIRKELEAQIDLFMTAVSLGFDAAKMQKGDMDGLKSAIDDGLKAVNGVRAAIEAAQGPGSGDDLSASADVLLDQQSALLSGILNSNLLWHAAMQGQSGAVLPTNLASITIDPVTSWDNYLAAAEAALDTLRDSLGDDGKAALDSYRASLKILVGYGKAIGSKFAAYVAQLVQATVVLAQIRAAKNVEARWQAVESAAKSDEEKLAALKAVLQSRANGIKRSLYVAWSYYSACYFYLTFTSPPHVVRMSMDKAQLSDALAGVADWVMRATGDAPDGQHVTLPSTDAVISLSFAIGRNGATGGGDVAILEGDAQSGWTLTWTVPLGTEQLNGVLPNGGDCAIWISKADFRIQGVTPNSKGNVIAKVATSGAYENGFGPQHGHVFVTKGLVGNYAYAAANDTTYSPWQVATAVYMTPSPYTQWTMFLPPNSGDPSAASTLRMDLHVAYLSPS
ncbi:MAG: hypothetical protein H0W24_05895 [Lysobacter sp.]|nr:hypothetical protein [Lysobacter sp.]